MTSFFLIVLRKRCVHIEIVCVFRVCIHTGDAVRMSGLCDVIIFVCPQMRTERFKEGSVRLDNPRLTFKLDDDGNPVSSKPYITGSSNHLVEEFMLLANRRVAAFISRVFPDRSLLRRHPPPDRKKLEDLAAFMQRHDLPLDCSNSRGLAESLRTVVNDRPEALSVVLLHATKPMQLAMYFCTKDYEMEEWRHYALSFEQYTHFTSPIRRYPDIEVHRLLQAALDVSRSSSPTDDFPDSLRDPERLSHLALHCNERKLSAKNAQDASIHLYVCVMLKDR